MRFINHRVNFCLSVLLFTAPAARADGGVPRLSERAGSYRVSVFTSPTPFRAGSVDVSVLVQEADSGALVPEVQVTVSAAPRGRPGTFVSNSATTEAAANKLYRAAVFELPEPGWWEIEVAIEGGRGSAHVRFALEAADRPPVWWTLAPWVGWPALVVGLFTVHQLLVRRKSRLAELRRPDQRALAPDPDARVPRGWSGRRHAAARASPPCLRPLPATRCGGRG